MNEIIALAVKDLKLLVRDKAGFFFTFFFPIIIAVFFGSIFSGGSKTSTIHLLVVDQDNTEQSREFISVLEKAPELRIHLATLEEAVELVRRGKFAAYVVFNAGFGESQKNIFWGKPPEIELGIDPARSTTTGMLQGILMKYGVLRFQKTFSDANLMHSNIETALSSLKQSDNMEPGSKQHLQSFLSELDLFLSHPATRSELNESESNEFNGFQPLVIQTNEIAVEDKGPKNGYAVSFPQGIIWGIIGCAAAFGISLVVERTTGTLVRLRIAPVSQMQILGGKALACFLTTLSISIGLILLARILFKVVPDSIPNLVLAILSICAGFVGIMMLLSVLGKTEQAASGIGWAILLIMSMTGGGMIPLLIMPEWMQTISHFSPVKWSILALEGAIWRQFTLTEMIMPCSLILMTGIAGFSVGVRLFSRMVKE